MVSDINIPHNMNDALVLKLFQFGVEYIPSYCQFSGSKSIRIKSEVKLNSWSVSVSLTGW